MLLSHPDKSCPRLSCSFLFFVFAFRFSLFVLSFVFVVRVCCSFLFVVSAVRVCVSFFVFNVFERGRVC